MGGSLAWQLICIAIVPTLPAPSWAQGNLVRNGDFREVEAGRPVAWAGYGNAQHVDQSLTVIREGKGNVARLQCRRIDGQGGDIHAMIAQVGSIRLVAGRLYALTCRARGEGIVGRTVSVAITDTSSWENCGLERDLLLSSRWRAYRFLFRATRNVDATSRLQFWFTEPGTFYLADVRLTEAPVQSVTFTQVVPATDSRNLLPNGAFNVGSAGWTSSGIPAGWGNIAHLHGSVVSSRDPLRPRFLRISLGPAETPVLYFDYFHPSAVVQTRLLAASVGWIPVSTGKPYTLSCDVRANLPGTPVVLGWEGSDPSRGPWDRTGGETHETAGPSWRRYTFTFTPSRPYIYVEVGPDLARNEAVHVDITRVQLEQGAAATPYVPHDAIESAWEAEAAGGIYAHSTKNTVRLYLHNNRPHSVRVPLTISAEDYFDRRITIGHRTIVLPPGGTAVHRVPIPPEWSGFYRLFATGPWGTRHLRIAVIPAEAARGTVFGINHAFADAALIRLARRAGISWYRDWSLKWNDVEPRQGHYDFTKPEEQISRVLAEGCHVLCLLPPFPSNDWSSEAPTNLAKPGYPGERMRHAYAPKDPDLLADFVRRTVRHFMPRVRVWEFLNEPIYTDYALPARAVRPNGQSYSVADYAKLLKLAAAAMHQADPACTVIGGIASGPKHLTREELAAGVLASVDALNLHIYPGTRVPEGYLPEMLELNRLMAQYGGRKPIWITEFGYYAADDLGRTPFIPDTANFPEPILLDTEQQAADYTIRFTALMLATGVRKIFLHAGSSGLPNRPSFECPLFGAGGSPHKLLPAIAFFNTAVSSDMLAGPVRRLGKDGYAVQFSDTHRSVLVLWTADRPMTLGALPSGTTAYDIMGRKIHQLVLSQSPIYVTGPRSRIQKWAHSWTSHQTLRQVAGLSRFGRRILQCGNTAAAR